MNRILIISFKNILNAFPACQLNSQIFNNCTKLFLSTNLFQHSFGFILVKTVLMGLFLSYEMYIGVMLLQPRFHT